MLYSRFLLLFSFCLLPFLGISQLTAIDHWETAVFETDNWHYLGNNTAPPSDWNQASFSPTSWQVGQGGIGYADGDDNTVISPTLAVFMRLNFNIFDTSKVMAAILHADFDDSFVAYLNGHEIARSNIGTVGIPPLHTDVADTYKEALMYQGGQPDAFLLFKDSLSQYLQQGNNILAIQVHNNVSTSSDMSARFFLSVGLNDTATPYNPVPSWFTAPFLYSNLPLVSINTNGQTIPEETKIMADMQIINNGNGNLNYIDDQPNDYNGKIGIEIRGASSLSFGKKGYGLETRDSLGENNNVSLLGMPVENDWVLHGPYADKSLLRNFLTYHIGNQLGGYTPKVRFCEVFLDNQYWGIYVLMEKIKRDKNRVNISKLSPTDTVGDELTGGYIFKIDRDMGPENGWFATSGYGYYAYHYPNGEDLHQKQKDYIQNYMNSFEARMQTASYADPNVGYPAWIDIPSFIDYMLIQEVTRNIDAYRLSAFMYKEKDSKGGKLYAGPIWDYNLGYGNEDFCDNGYYTSWAFNYNQVCGSPFPLFWDKLVGHSDFRNTFNCRWNELRSTVLHTDTILHFVDSMVVLLHDAQVRNFERWNVLGTYVWPNAYVGQNYADEINYLRNWIKFRMSWIDSNMIGVPCIPTPTNEPKEASNFRVYPNPFRESLSFEMQNPQPMTIHLYDVLGQIIETVHLKSGDSFYQMNTNDLPSGAYFYAIYQDGKLIANGKTIKQ